MIPDFKTYIGESVWNDIRKRGTGSEIKKEDEIPSHLKDCLLKYIEMCIESNEYCAADLTEFTMYIEDFAYHPDIKKFDVDCDELIEYVEAHWDDVVHPLIQKIMIPDFRTYIGESVWNDIRKRGNGNDVKKEDKFIIGFGISEMYDYLRDSYKDKVYWIDGDKKGCIDDGSIGMDPVEGISMYFDYGEDDKLTEIVMFYTTKSFSEDPKEYPEFFKKLSNAFNVSIYNNKPEFSKQWTIKPKSGELTNKTIIEVIEFFLNTEINESVWGDIRKRGNGTDVKNEDILDNIYNFINVHYFVGFVGMDDIEFKDDHIHVPIYTVVGLNAFAAVNIYKDSLNFSSIDPDRYTTQSLRKFVTHIKGDINQLFDKIKDTYSPEISTFDGHDHWIDFEIKPKDGKITPKFCEEFIDFILNNTTDNNNKILKLLEKK